MLRLGGRRLRRNADFHRLHQKYPNPEAATTQWLLKVLPEKEARDVLASYRDEALYYYVEQAALLMRIRRSRKKIRTQLRSLGGRLARLKAKAGNDSEITKIEFEIRSLRNRIELGKRQPDLLFAQWRWHFAMVMTYHCLLSKKD